MCVQLHASWLFLTGALTDSNESTISLGLVGGMVFLFICLILLCIVIMYMYIRYSNNKKRTHAVDKDVAAKSNLDVAMNVNINPSYNITEQNQEHQYDYVQGVFHKKYSLQEKTLDIVKMESDPAYGGNQCLNSVLNNLPEFQGNDDAAIHKEYSLQENTQDVVKMESDPAYGGIQDLNPVLNNLPEFQNNDDATIHPNLSCSCNLETTKTSEDEDEDQHGYVRTDLHNVPQGADYLQLIESTVPV